MNPTILIIEDDQDLGRTLAETLQDEGYSVQLASGGSEALEWLRHDTPSLILLDLMMPRVSGWDVCEKLSQESRFSQIPVILMTAASNLKLPLPSHPRRVLRKPFLLEELLGEMQQLVRA